MLKKLHWSELALWGIALSAIALAAAPSFAQNATKHAGAVATSGMAGAVSSAKLGAASSAASGAKSNIASSAAVSIERGRYIAKIGGCNDCHTAGYAPSGGKVPEAEWLKGDALGWNGPWGTTYPANLRITLSKLTEDGWVKLAKTAEFRPPMPWFGLHDMTEADLRSFYRFVRSLGAPGEPAPAFLPPGETPQGPTIRFPAPPQ